MKLLYTVIIWGLIQLFACQTLAASQPTLAKDQLVLYYENELQFFAKEFSEKAKNLSEKILQDSNIQMAKSPIIREFKNNITEFLNNYNLYKHFGLNNGLLTQFITTTIQYYLQEPTTNKDFQYILKLLRKLRYDQLCDEYEVKFQKFVREKFLPIFEELKTQLLTEMPKQSANLANWYNDLRQCQDYKCYYKSFDKFKSVIISPTYQFLDFMRLKLESFFMYYSNQAYIISRAVIEDSLLSLLSHAFREQFVNDVNEFLHKCESNHDIRELYNLILLFRSNILEKYYYNKAIKIQYQVAFKNIFDKHDVVKFLENYQLKFNVFVNTEVFEKYQELMATLDEDEFRQRKPLIERFEYLLDMTNQTERVKQVEMVYLWV